MKVQVVKGQIVRITLSCTTTTKAARVEYLVRDLPTLGVVGTLLPAPEDRTKATIIYQSASQSEGKVDMFSFYARYNGGDYSAPAQVIIELIEPEARIETPSTVGFGNLILGDETDREILLKNTGNIEYRKQIQLPPPLALIEPDDGNVSIPAGGSKILKIRYRPEQVGIFKTNYIFQDKPGITFIGNAFAPFATSTKKISLLWDERKRNRQGQLQVTNKAKTPISIKINSPARTRAITENVTPNSPLILAPGKSTLVAIALPKEDVQSFKGNLEISSDHYTQTILLESSPTPPFLQIELPDPSRDHIDFGTAAPGEQISRTFMIKNTGGTGSLIGLGALPPFQLAKNVSGAQGDTYSLSPESSAAFIVKFNAPPKQFGNYSDSLEISSNVGALRIPLTAVVNNPNPMAGQIPIPPPIKKTPEQKLIAAAAENALPTPSRLPPTQDPKEIDYFRSPSGFHTRDYVGRNYLDSIPAPTKFRLIKARHHGMTLAWELPSANHTVFEIEMRRMLVNQSTHEIESAWVPFHEVDFKRSDGMMRATITGLTPSTVYEFRVLTTGTGGYFSKPSEAFQVSTKRRIDLRWLNKWVYFLIVVAIVVLLNWYWNKNGGCFPMPTYWPRTIPWPFD